MSVLSYWLAINNRTLNVNDKTLTNFGIKSVIKALRH